MRQGLLLLIILSSLTCCTVRKAPTPILPVPTEAQIHWQRMQTYAFVHFGLNTYNDLEWGYGNTPMATFCPDTLDVEQWVRTFKQAGMQGVILTAKHHDGFCLWPTATTDYSVKNSPWRGGKGDLVRELSDACRRHGLRLGLYLSPWDRNNADYGKAGYQRIFHEQIRELATGYGELFEYWFDGANGGNGWYGGADEQRTIDPNTYYMYEDAVKILQANNPDIMIFGGTVPTIRWIGNERGWAGQTNYSAYTPAKQTNHRQAQWGMRDGDQWLPGEVDVSIRPGWFYHHREDHQVRSVANLTNLYYQSVGRNATLLLNFPIALDGRIPKTDSINAVQWHEHIKQSFAHDLLRSAKVTARDTRRGKRFAPRHLVDGSDETYWATHDHVETVEVSFNFARSKVNVVDLREYIRLGQCVESFSLETRDTLGIWRPIQTADSLTTIGYRRLIRLNTTETDGLRLRITKAKGPVCLASISAYLVPELVEAPQARRTANDELVLTSAIASNKLRFRVEGGAWQPYLGPTMLPRDHVSIDAEASNDNGQVATTSIRLGYSARSLTVDDLEEAQRLRLLDGDGFSAVTLPRGKRELTLRFAQPSPISSVQYTPNQGRDAGGHIQSYELYIDDVRVAQGEFSNIKHNPIPVSIELPQTIVGSTVRLVATHVVDNSPSITIGDLSIF